MSERADRHAQAIWKIAGLLQNAEDLNAALSACLETALPALDSEAGTVWILDRGSDRIFPAVSHGPVDITGITIEKGQGIAGDVISNSRTANVSAADDDERFSDSVDDISGFRTKSVLCVPLTDGNGTMGCIQVINKKGQAGFSEQDVDLCEEMASLVGIALREKGLSTELWLKKKILISLRGITKDFPSGEGTLQVLRGINLDIYSGEFLVILGESGCGKSTLINIIGGMERPTGGTITVEGRDFTDPTEQELTLFRRKYLGFVFQSYHLMPNLTVRENVRFIAELTDNAGHVDDVLELLHLSDRAGHFPSALSGGQQQRVAIARALVKRPTILFADEPTAALDYQTSLKVLSSFEEIQRSLGVTIVLITHNSEIARMADRVIRMKSGKIASIRYNPNPASAAELSW